MNHLSGTEDKVIEAEMRWFDAELLLEEDAAEPITLVAVEDDLMLLLLLF